jgi:dolichyl-phosphate beta-glucosyltransferase
VRVQSDDNDPVSVVVPVFDEMARLAPAIDQLVEFVAGRGSGSELIFVDDGSTDGTASALEARASEHDRVPLRVLRREHEGKGAAVQAGILAASCAIVAFCDVDLATPLDELGRIIDAAAQGALAIGSRGLPTSRLGTREHPVREGLGKSFNRAAQLLVTPGIADTQCGAKAAPRSLWDEILTGATEPGFAWDVEVIARALAGGHRVVEVPITWNHQSGSAIRVARDGVQMLAALPRIRRRVRAAHSHASTSADRLHTTAVAMTAVRTADAGVFDDENAATLAAAETAHWWFRSRAAYVNWALGRFAPRQGWLVDLGAGGGGVTARLAWDPAAVLAVEGNDQLAAQAAHGQRIRTVRADVSTPPIRAQSAAVVCLLDVVEHSTVPVALLRAGAALLRDDGVFVVTVPGHQWLWSRADDVLGHQRRYARRTLRADLEAAGLRVEYIGHIFSWLVPPVWLRRRVVHPRSPELGLETGGPLIDGMALVLTASERSLLRRVSLPVGTSVLAVARRPVAGGLR